MKEQYTIQEMLQMFKDFVEACEQSQPTKEFIMNSLIAFLYDATELEEE